MFVALEVSQQVITTLQPLMVALRTRDAALVRQIVNAASSISLNLAEGAERAGRDQLHHYRIAAGSCREVRAALRVAVGWKHLTPAQVASAESLLDRMGGLLYGLTRQRA